ncbi:radical SAM protein [Mesobacillus sp. AQ2]|uniref:radical SAM protein n=1 Tax=unclassified Mesobacillus TaxID=2675270 RepID=UPI002041FB3D|nr:radical SAM protein [Mesobacillus sp. AQ2]MCM3124970.1 radical SAM protein [Mesobacillus sp. MER 33]MCM3235270.1 radical SAM protein [Mesobacillus sp. MER 48]WHX39799.1 radical SAM protein [Mesobacillus sp. AQ2]
MIRTLEQDLEKIQNQSLNRYARIYKDIEKETLKHIEQFGLTFEGRPDQTEREKQLKDLKGCDAAFRNNGKSVVSNGKISTACEACQTGVGSYTNFVSLKCHRDCYFCFNKNQDNYQFYHENQRNAVEELDQLFDSGSTVTHLALTGGEPLLHPGETIDFFRKANKFNPAIHTRLYTAGDLLTKDILIELRLAGLNEIRFSIKLEDSKQKQKHILQKIKLAKDFIPDVMVEMPVIPGTEKEMKELLSALEEVGIFGINLLEFCFPLGNADAFQERGFKLKNPPYDIYYNFWYAGGLAVAESEKLCLELVRFAIEKKFNMGVHYCSLENKFTGQIYQQNYNQVLDETYTFSPVDYYFKTAKVFGKDRKTVRKVLEKKKIPYIENCDYDFLQFPVESIPFLRNKEIPIIMSSNVVEIDEDGRSIREVHLEFIHPTELEKFRRKGD